MSRSAVPEFERFRAGFPGAHASPYLNVADRGLLSVQVRQAIEVYLDTCMSGPKPDDAQVWIELARTRFSELVRAGEDEVSIVKNVSDGINAFAWAVDWRPGDNVVVCGGLEHPSNRIPWCNIRDRCGVTVRSAKSRGGQIDVDRLIALIDERTRVVSASLVTFAPGFRMDARRLGEACRARGVPLLIDAAQAVGILDIDLQDLPVDVLVASTPKALLGLYGLGFLFVRADLAATLRPRYLSQMGIEPDAGPDNRDVSFKSGARRFDVGNFNQVGCVAAASSIEQIIALGTAGIERHVTGLSRDLILGLKELDIPVIAADGDAERVHIVAIGRTIEDTLDDTSDPDLKDLFQFLTAEGIRTSIRLGIIRLSLHAYNDRDDVAATIDAVRRWRALPRRRFASE